jgi:hypothetical protein
MEGKVLERFSNSCSVITQPRYRTVASLAQHPPHLAGAVAVVYADTGLAFADMT